MVRLEVLLLIPTVLLSVSSQINVAKHGLATQSSTATYGDAYRAIDGNTDPTWRDNPS